MQAAVLYGAKDIRIESVSTNVFREAISLAASGRINLQPFSKGVFPMKYVAKALAAAIDRVSALKYSWKYNRQCNHSIILICCFV